MNVDSVRGVAVGVIGRARAGATAAFVAQGFGFAVILTHLSAFKTRWDLDDLGVTGVMFGVAVLAGVGSTLAGLFAARRGSSIALRAALSTAAVGLLITGLAGGFAVFLTGLAVYGLGLGSVDASENMQAVAVETVLGRSVLTSFHAAWSAGGIAGALYTSAGASAGWSLPVTLAPVALVPAVCALAPLLGRTPTAPADHRKPAEFPGAAGNSAVNAAVNSGPDPARDPDPDLAAGGAMIPWRQLAVLGTALVLFYIADSAASSWSTVYLRDVLAATATVAPLAYAAYQATGLLSRLGGDLVVRRFGAVPVVRTAATVGVAGLLAVVLAPNPAIAVIGFAILGAGIAVVAPLTFSAVGALAAADDPEVGRRRADLLVARLNQFNYLGFVLGGVLTGLVSSAGSLRWGFVVPLVLTGVLMLLAPAFGRGIRS